MDEENLEFIQHCKEEWMRKPLRERIRIRVSGFFDDVVFTIEDILEWLFFDVDDDGNERIPGATIILDLATVGVLIALVIVTVSKR